tara:strand:- start:1991 stop:2368 length:378 start_codon:yes stop_codon:yes gene_type:complete
MIAIKNPNKNIGIRHKKYHIRITTIDKWGDKREIWRAVDGGIKEARKERDSLLIQMQSPDFFKPLGSAGAGIPISVTREQFLATISGTKFKSLRQIGNELGISRETARKLLRVYNVTKISKGAGR